VTVINNTKTITRKRETEPGLVAFYDMRSGNGSGLLSQPQSPYTALKTGVSVYGMVWYTRV